MKLFLCFAILFGASVSLADSLKAAVMDKAPFAFEENGKRQGFHYDVAEAIGKKSNYAVEIQLAPVMRVIEMLRNHSVDFIILTDYDELEKMKTQKTLLINLESSIYSLASDPIRSKDEVKTGPIVRLAKGCTDLNDDKNIRWFDAQSYEQAYDLLIAKRARGVCSTIAFWHAVDQKGDRKDIHAFTISKRPVWVQVLPDLDEKKWTAIQKAVKSLIKDGSVEKFAGKYAKLHPK